MGERINTSQVYYFAISLRTIVTDLRGASKANDTLPLVIRWASNVIVIGVSDPGTLTTMLIFSPRLRFSTNTTFSFVKNRAGKHAGTLDILQKQLNPVNA